MVPSAIPATSYQRGEARGEFERARKELRAAMDTLPADDAAQRLLSLGATLDTGVGRLKRDLLGTSLCWTDENQRLMDWVEQQHRAILEMSSRLVETLRVSPGPMLPRVIASSLHHWGQATKWSMGRERPPFKLLHGLMVLAMSCGRHREKLLCQVDGGAKRTSIEALYLRVLLLDRFTSGSLTRPQVEVLDAWLWEWSDELRAERHAPEGACLRVELEENHGLREGRGASEVGVLFLALAPLEKRRASIVAGLHLGRMVPCYGCASDLRIEEHVAVLDFLARTFQSPEAEAASRAPREMAGAVRTEVWVGLPEILSRGIGVGIETGRFRALSLDDAQVTALAAQRFSDAVKRYFWLNDTSASGLGFEALESDAAGIEVGELLGWKRVTGGPVFLGRVTRRMHRGSGEVFFGVQLLTDCAQPLKLRTPGASKGVDDERSALFVAGADDSGRHDGFLIPENGFDSKSTHEVGIAGREFTLRFNRVRLKGRGWMLAGFEMVPAFVAREGELPELEMAAAEPDDPFCKEVPSRLLQ